jgi:REP element-mobilizing transposase RayT
MPPLPTRKKIRLPDSAYRQGHAFSVTINTHERYPWFQNHKELPEKLTQVLLSLASERRADLFAWCLMPDHLHLLIQDKHLVDFIRLLKGRMVPEARRLEQGRPLWQHSYFDHALRREETTESVALYIWENPVRAGLIERASNYPWSGSLVWADWRERF